MPRPLLTTDDGVMLAGRRWNASSAAPAAIVLVHGFSASARCPQVVALAEALQGAGFDVVSYDARGHGDSAGESTLGDAERHDVAAAVEIARHRSPRVVLVGASMGAIAALRYAATDPSLAGVVTVSCPARWRLPRNPHGVLGALMTRTPFGRRLTASLSGIRVAAAWTGPEPPLALVPRVRAPLAVVHGSRDRFISAHDAIALHDAATSRARIDIVPHMGHAFGPAARTPILEAVDWTLGADTGAVDARPA